MVKDHSDSDKETCCCHIGYSFRLITRVLLYAPSHRHDSTYHSLCYTSRGALAGMKNSVKKVIKILQDMLDVSALVGYQAKHFIAGMELTSSKFLLDHLIYCLFLANALQLVHTTLSVYYPFYEIYNIKYNCII